MAERTAWLHSVAPICASSPAACTAVLASANGSGPRRCLGGGLVAYPAGGTTGSSARPLDADGTPAAARDRAVVRCRRPAAARGLAGARFGALRSPAVAGLRGLAAGRAAEAFARARAGAPAGAAGGGAAGGVASSAGPAPAGGGAISGAGPAAAGDGVSRLALRRAGRVRGRLVRTSRSLPFS